MSDHPGSPGVGPGVGLGFGIGLRRPHYDHVLEHRPPVDWFELISENHIAPGGRPRNILRRIREHYPVVLHGLSFNIGTNEPLDTGYLDALKALIRDIEPAWVSDHICWTGLHGRTSHDLLPIAYNKETLQLVSDRVNRIQDYLGQTVVLENPSTYLQFRSCDISEPDFINALVDNTGCRILLDINNVYVSSFNLGFDASEYINTLKPDCVQQFHLAGHSNNGTHIVDTHDHPVCDEVWALYRQACQRFGAVATLLERDDRIPAFDELLTELDQARAVQADALASLTTDAPPRRQQA